jgi:hypothetical protein
MMTAADSSVAMMTLNSVAPPQEIPLAKIAKNTKGNQGSQSLGGLGVLARNPSVSSKRH